MTESQNQEYTIQKSGGRNIVFTGELLAEVRDSSDPAHPAYSGETGVYHILRLYRTVGGAYVCESCRYSNWVDQNDVISGTACQTTDEVFDYFGGEKLAKQLYDEAGLEYAERIA